VSFGASVAEGRGAVAVCRPANPAVGRSTGATGPAVALVVSSERVAIVLHRPHARPRRSWCDRSRPSDGVGSEPSKNPKVTRISQSGRVERRQKCYSFFRPPNTILAENARFANISIETTPGWACFLHEVPVRCLCGATPSVGSKASRFCLDCNTPAGGSQRFSTVAGRLGACHCQGHKMCSPGSMIAPGNVREA